MKRALVTGAAGFIGFHLCMKLMDQGVEVVGADNMNNYYDVRLKKYRCNLLLAQKRFTFHKLDLEDTDAVLRLFSQYKFDAVIHLAARAGVRYSMKNPQVYVTTNVLGTVNLLEGMRQFKVKKAVIASTSSLYAGQKMPFQEDYPVNTPFSPYAASKKAAEVLSYSYHYLYAIDVSIVRFFTVYGPAGRPDMSIFRFIRWIDSEEPIQLYGSGEQGRDFTYVSDAVDGTVKALKPVGYEIFNIARGQPPCPMNKVIELLEKALGKKARIKRMSELKIDLADTWADIAKARNMLGWEPKIPLEIGLARTVQWYKDNKDFVQSLQL